MAYRSERKRRSARDAPSTGVVADMVRQFADKYAFLRELVQNSIDAGATRLRVEVTRGGDDTVLTSVLDDGTGMTADTMESALLTLFSSTKEGDSGAIGKYGVGFVSVLAIAPEEVTVDTWRDGARHRLRLLPDHSWELAPLGGTDGHGTRVTLTTRADSDAFAAHVTAVRTALRRWCGHARVPIELCTPRSTETHLERIDAPMAVDALVSVRVERDGATLVLGAGARAPEAAFYSRGLLLLATHNSFDGLEQLTFKVDSARLAHTLSRDDVRRDAAFDSVLAELRRVARTELRQALVEALATAARTAAAGEPAQEHAQLFALGRAAPFTLRDDELWVPLCDPSSSARVATLATLERARPRRRPALLATRPDLLTALLANAGRPVAWLRDDLARRTFAEHFGQRTVADAHDVFVALAPVESRGSDATLLGAIESCLEAAGYPARSAVLTTRVGRACGHVGYFVSDPLPCVFESARLLGGGTRGTTLALDADHALVRLAREHASTDARVAGHLLTRLVLLDAEGTTPARRNEALLLHAAREPRP